MNFDHLALLIGTNPLPNFVVADYFLKKNPDLQNLHLIYSEEKQRQKGTLRYAENLHRLIQKRHEGRKLRIELVPLSDISRASEISRDIRSQLLSKLPQDAKIHLNYTGGTKAMSIHVYLEMRSFFKDSISFSYLDARTFRIIDDARGVISNDLRDCIKINIAEITDLHGFERINEPSPNFEEAVNVFKKLINSGNLDNYFNEYNRRLFTQKNNKGKLIEKKNQIKDELKNHQISGAILSVVRAMPEEYRFFDNCGTFKEPSRNKQVEKAVRFLDGEWLEQYTFTVLRDNFTADNISVDRDWQIKDPEWRSPTQRFQLDVILIKGYQLIGISCTTSGKRHVCKSKGFEINHRTWQIGGEEARSVLITRLEKQNKNELEEELSINTGGEKNIFILGKDDLKEELLVGKINEILR